MADRLLRSCFKSPASAINISEKSAKSLPNQHGKPGFRTVGKQPLMRTVCFLLLLAGCGKEPAVKPPQISEGNQNASDADNRSSDYGGYGGYGYYGTGEITFIDDVATNVAVGDEIASLTFTDIDGNETPLADYVGEKSVVLVITRGNTNPICPYCTTQTSRLIANYPKFAERNAEVLVVYPVEHGEDKDKLDAFLEATRELLDNPNQAVPFSILLDVELKAVDRLNIRKDLSKPATYILNPEGHVRFAYVGADINDRPSIDAMLNQLDADAERSETAAGES